MPRVIVVGDIVTDIVALQTGPIAVGSDTQAQISVTGGGSAANTAAWLARAGIAVDLVAVVGSDTAGQQRLAELNAAGVSCAAVRRSATAATGSVIVLTHAAERSMICDRGANLLLAPSDVDGVLDGATDASHLHLSGYPLLDSRSAPAARHGLTSARARGLTTSVDAASAAPLRRLGGTLFLDWVRGVDLLIANLDEASALLDIRESGVGAEAMARHLCQWARHVVVKRGPAGAVYAGRHSCVIAPAVEPSRVVDPTGAGDAFAAGLLASWLGGGEPAQFLAAGARLGAQAVAIPGGRPHPDAGSRPAPDR